MKLKKIVILISCTAITVAISSCSTSKPETETKTTVKDYDIKQATAAKVEPKAEAKPQTKAKAEKTVLKMNADASYTVGYQVGNGIAGQGFGLNNSKATAGFEDAMNGVESKISETDIRRNMDSLKDKMIKKQLEVSRENKTNSEDFMDKVSKIDNIVKVNDKVYYQMIKQGDGQKPNENSTVTIAYKGTTPVPAYQKDNAEFSDVKKGTLIGKSFDSNDSATFPLPNLIKCWKDAIPEITTGSTIVLYCASDVAYGSRAPATIGPNQALSFKITLKDFK